jgi:hypothetical protein
MPQSDIKGRGEPPALLNCGGCFSSRYPGSWSFKKTGYNRHGGVLSEKWGKKKLAKILVLLPFITNPLKLHACLGYLNHELLPSFHYIPNNFK